MDNNRNLVTLLNVFFTLLMALSFFGCNNPNGDSVLSADHAPLLKPPGDFNFTTVQVKSQTASLHWDAAARTTEYRVFYGFSATSMPNELKSCRGLIRSCSLNELQKGVTYFFKVVAYNQGGEKNISSLRQVRIIAPFSLTSIYTGTEANQLIVTFPKDTIGADNYNVRYGTDPLNLDQVLNNVTSPAVIPNLIGGDLYYVAVEATNTIGDGITVVSSNTLSEVPLVKLYPPMIVNAVGSPDKVNLSWPSANGAKWYVILRRSGSGAFQEIATNIKTLNYLDTTVTNGVTYEYVVRASNGADSEDSAGVFIRPISAFTLHPASSITTSGSLMAWGSATGSDKYEIHLKTSTGSYTKLATQSGLTYSFTGLQPGTTYVAKIVATNAITQPDTISTSNEVTFTTSPLPVTNLSANSSTSGSINLSWTAPFSNSPLTYTVKRGTVSGLFPVTLTNNLLTTSFVDSTVIDGTDYYYMVMANNGTPSAESLEVAKRPISNCSITSSTAINKTSLSLNWSTCVGADFYDVIISTSAGATTPVVATLSAPVNSYTVTGLNHSTNYYLKIRARNSVGTGVTRLSAETQQVTYPIPPTISVIAAPGQATLSWSAIPTATSYRVLRGTQPGFYDTELTITTVSRVDTGLTNNQTYYYAVRSNNGFESDISSEVGVKPIANFSIGSTSVSTTSITVNWAAPAGADIYDLQYKKSSDTLFTTLTNQASGTIISGLSSGTPYDLRVVAKNVVGTNTTTVSTPILSVKTTPAWATGHAITINSTNGSVGLSWPTIAGGEQYRIYRSTSPGSPSTTPYATVTTTSYTDTTLTAGTQYYYTVSAFNGTESSLLSEVSIRPIGPFGNPTVTALSSSSLKVDWGAATGATVYKLYYKLQTASLFTPPITVTGTSSHTLTGLTPGVGYTVYIEASNTDGKGASRSTNWVNVSTWPSTISTLAATSTEAQKVSLSWTPVAGATRYNIYRGSSAQSLSYIGMVTGQSAASYLDSSGLSGGSVYFYSVRPHNGSVEVADSNIQSIKVIGSFNLTGASAASSTSVNLTWTSALGADSYDVYYGPSSVPLFDIQGIGSSSSTTYTLTGLNPATLYYIKIRARNATGSNVFTVMSLPLTVTTSPSAPVLSGTSVTSGSISFQVANATGATSYSVYRSENSGGPYSQIASGKTASTFTDNSATNGKTWYYVVRSFNGTESVNSNEVAGRPLPSVAINTIQDLSSTSVRISWSFSEAINGEGISYQLKWGTSPTNLSQTETLSSSPFDLSGLSSDTSYYFQIIASNLVGPGTSVLSSVITGKTNSPPAMNVIADQETSSNEVKTLLLMITDNNDLLDCSTLIVTSSDQSIVSETDIITTALGPNSCSLVITPQGITGLTTIGLRISDGKDATTASFKLNVVACKVDYIGWVSAPSSLEAGQSWSPAPKVVLRSNNSNGPICDDDLAPVYLALAKDSSLEQDAMITGGVKAVPVGGYAEFPSAGMTRAGTGYTMVASQGEVISEQSSTPFSVTSTGTMSQIIWGAMPNSFAKEELLSPVPTLYTADEYGNAIAPYTSLDLSLSLYSEDGSIVSTIENSPVTTSTGVVSVGNTILQENGSFYFRASHETLGLKDSIPFSVTSPTRGNTSTTLEMLQGPIVHDKNYAVIYPRSTLLLGKNSIDGTNTYRWRIVATHSGSTPGIVVLREGATQKGSITLTPNSTTPTSYETTFSGPELANGKWTVSLSGNVTLISSQLIIEQTQASRSISYIPLSSLPAGESFIKISHSSLQNPGISTFPTFTYDWSSLPRLESAKLVMVSKGNEATSCVQLFSKTNNSPIGNQLCRTGGAESVSTLDIPIANLPTTLDEIEVRSKSNNGEGHLFKAGLLLTFHGL